MKLETQLEPLEPKSGHSESDQGSGSPLSFAIVDLKHAPSCLFWFYYTLLNVQQQIGQKKKVETKLHKNMKSGFTES